MPVQVQRRESIWMFGKEYPFDVYGVIDNAGNLVPLIAAQYREDNLGNPLERQKNQIVLHFTAANSRADQTVNYWNDKGLRPNYYCPRWEDGPHHHFGSPNPGVCPSGHGALIGHWASAHYVVELAEDRLNPGTQPYANVIEVAPSNYVTFHGEAVNQYSIGIEHANVGDNWAVARNHAAFVVPAVPADSTPPANTRPADFNRWLHLLRTFPPNVSNIDHPSDFQAYQEEQYLAMILLLRHLCIKHRIPRRFLGETIEEKMQRWWHNLGASESLTRSKLMRFRGILSHMNCHATKECGGPAMHRNRLFRGIIDEWWLPLQFDGTERSYHTGPFDPQPNQPSYFRWTAAGAQAELFHDANLDALQETNSYFNLDHVARYYAETESASRGGTFPIGTNKSWHGGVHLAPRGANSKVYAAASGTIVAARLGSDAATENDPQWGSQRFVLIRHCVYIEQEADPGGGMRINYNAAPKYIFTLYMHLAPVADPSAVNQGNPPWFNYWRRHRTVASNPTDVFCPNVEVAVGDWLGECGVFSGNRMIHFEVISKEEITVAPWDDPDHRVEDASGSMICTVPTIDRFVRARHGYGIDTIDILGAVRDLRRVKSYHKSEWSLASGDALQPMLPGPFASIYARIWARLQNFMWVADALAKCPDLATQLCDATGMMWHYHPVTFMEFINRLIVGENGQVSEPDLTATNVTLEDGYLTSFVDFSTGAAVAASADGQGVKPFDVSSLPGSFQYHFTRADLACSGPAPHDPPATPPRRTRFHLSLLDVLESIRIQYNAGIVAVRSHLCEGHAANTIPNFPLCVLGTAYALRKHAAGLAVDIRPAAPNPAHCRSLWISALAAASVLHSSCHEHAGEPSRADLSGPVGSVQGVKISTTPALEAKLNAGTALTPAEAAACVIHLELMLQLNTPIVWECWIRQPTRSTAVKLVDNGIIGVFNSRDDAEAERATPQSVVRQQSGSWECAIRQYTQAISVRLEGSGIVGVFYSAADAETEKGPGDAWFKEASPNLI